MANTTVSTTNFETMALKSVMATILETGTMCNMIPSLSCVSFDKDHHEEIVGIVKQLNNAKSKEDLEKAYGEYFIIGIKAGAPIHEILMAIHSRTQINDKFHFDTKKWIEESMKASTEHPEDDEPEAEEAAPAEPAKAEPKKDESKKDSKPAPTKPAVEPKKDSKPAEPKKDESKKDSKPTQNAEPAKPAAKSTEPKKTSMFQATEPVEGSAANKLGFDISKFIKPETARQATVVPAPVAKPAEPQQPVVNQQATPVATAPAEPAKPAEPVDPKKAEEELKKKVEEMNKNFHLIKGTHPGFTLEQVNSLLMLAKNGFIKNKMKECDAKDRPNNPQFYEIPLAPYETDENKGKFDICFKLNTKDKKHPIIILYNTRPTFEKSINANINNMETFRA